MLLKVVSEPTQPGNRYFTKIRFLFCRIKNLFRKPKPFNITEIDTEYLNLFHEFVLHYQWSKQTMILQERSFKKSSTYESSLVVEYQWFSMLSVDRKHFLSEYGLHAVINELEVFIEKWEYKPLKRCSHKTVNYLPNFLKSKS